VVYLCRGCRLKSGKEKEYKAMLKYIPYFNRIVDVLLGTGEPGQKFLEICAKYMENLTFARERGKKTAITTFCFSPSIFMPWISCRSASRFFPL